MQRRAFPIAGSIIFAGGLALRLAALAGDIDLSEQNIVSNIWLQPGWATHETRTDSQSALQFPNPSQNMAVEAFSPAPATRGSFMATWKTITDATGYLLDVS